jgi:hypothetical protein
MVRDWRAAALIYALLGVVFVPLSEWLATHPFGFGGLIFWQMMFVLPLVVALMSSPVLLIAMLFKSSRRRACILVVFALAGFVGFFGGARLGHRVRMSGMRTFATRSEAVVAAIRRYEQDHGEPPSDLESLVPAYLSTAPTTAMAAYPDYRYHSGVEASEKFYGNTWALSVFTPRPVINFDMMVYLPNQNYPERAYGGWLERVGSWAYVHE